MRKPSNIFTTRLPTPRLGADADADALPHAARSPLFHIRPPKNRWNFTASPGWTKEEVRVFFLFVGRRRHKGIVGRSPSSLALPSPLSLTAALSSPFPAKKRRQQKRPTSCASAS
jgi:hypothetical protein